MAQKIAAVVRISLLKTLWCLRAMDSSKDSHSSKDIGSIVHLAHDSILIQRQEVGFLVDKCYRCA